MTDTISDRSTLGCDCYMGCDSLLVGTRGEAVTRIVIKLSTVIRARRCVGFTAT